MRKAAWKKAAPLPYFAVAFFFTVAAGVSCSIVRWSRKLSAYPLTASSFLALPLLMTGPALLDLGSHWKWWSTDGGD
ncbi:MAG: hypothetical protein ACRD96_25910, partial [Bryobacteraceae bacterium]